MLRAEAHAIEAWTYCLRATTAVWEAQNPKYASVMTVKDVMDATSACGPYPGHVAVAQYTPDAKGSSMFNVPLLPTLAPVLTGVVP